MSLFIFSACTPDHKEEVDRLNRLSYAYHYRNIDSTEKYADSAYVLSYDYKNGMAEALNNKAFVCTMRMDYDNAGHLLDKVVETTDNQIELLIADVQQMRICQRMSKNKEFYDFRERAKRRIKRIDEERGMLSDNLRKRLIYAESEFYIVSSTYYYYVGLEQNSIQELQKINADELMQEDSAQYLDYLYNVGAGGIIIANTQTDVNQQEFDYLMRCLLLANQGNYPFWIANSLQGLSEHLMTPVYGKRIIRDNLPAMKYLNSQQIPDSLLAGNLSEQSVSIFKHYGDPYQLAGSYRTLASCYFNLGDYNSCIYNLEMALNAHPVIQKAPDLVASIREKMSVAFSAINNKYMSDYNRNIYIDLQDMTRQDRYLESRAEQYDKTSTILNWMIVAVLLVIILVIVLLWIFNRLRINNTGEEQIKQLLKPLREWQESNKTIIKDLNDKFENINEATQLNETHILNNRRRNLENRAKVSLVVSITPFIDRILHEINRLKDTKEPADIQKERYKYVAELTDKINDYNTVLTEWIQLRQGLLSIHIESFSLQQLFDTIGHSRMSFNLKGIKLDIEPTKEIVKADKILTLFMINTLADNARKFTSRGGTVTISAESTDKYVEISIKDTGCGISDDKLSDIFDHKVYGGHGFGLMNCKGIIGKYLKISRIFSVCCLSAESEKGKGSRFYFRLPKGVIRSILTLCIFLFGLNFSFAARPEHNNIHFNDINLKQANRYADSAYYSNIHGTYTNTLLFADTCRYYLNKFYLKKHIEGKDLMNFDKTSNGDPAEIKWYRDSLPTDYNIILDIRNESAVAALALHKWNVYKYNNQIYTQLFKEMSADSKLGQYCRTMQKSEINKTVAVVLLILLLISIIPAYYFIYYRHKLYYRFCVEQIKHINQILLSDRTASEKLKLINPVVNEKYPLALEQIVLQIQQALKLSIDISERQQNNIEMADDERRRAEYEDNMLYVSNSVLDNCLSTLKHETMYYPNRIRQLVDADEHNIQAISEVAIYYKELYSILSTQAANQTEHSKYNINTIPVGVFTGRSDSNLKVYGDLDMLKYMFSILEKQNGKCTSDKPSSISAMPYGDKYIKFIVSMPGVNLTDDETHDLFTPSSTHIPYMLCSQIVRDHSEFTNHRGCGIRAELNENKEVQIIILLPRKE